MQDKGLGKTSLGIEPHIATFLSYFLGFTGIIFYLLEEENKFVRFHAFQSMAVFGLIFVLSTLVATLFVFF